MKKKSFHHYQHCTPSAVGVVFCLSDRTISIKSYSRIYELQVKEYNHIWVIIVLCAITTVLVDSATRLYSIDTEAQPCRNNGGVLYRFTPLRHGKKKKDRQVVLSPPYEISTNLFSSLPHCTGRSIWVYHPYEYLTGLVRCSGHPVGVALKGGGVACHTVTPRLGYVAV